MQHTLLPLKERNILRREYRMRVMIIFCFLLSLAGLIGAAALFPSFLFALNEEKEQLQTLKNIKKTENDGGVTKLELEFKRDNELIKLLSEESKIPPPSNTIQSVVGVRGPVKLTTISVDNSSSDVISIIIQGIAPNRDTLLAFKGRLEQLVPGGGVELPVSDLAKSKDLQFSMRITQTFP